MPDLIQLSHFYPATYHSFDINNILGQLKQRQRFRRLRSFVESDAITLLDYGCGSGVFIDIPIIKSPGIPYFYLKEATEEISRK